MSATIKNKIQVRACVCVCVHVCMRVNVNVYTCVTRTGVSHMQVCQDRSKEVH